jgi:hypothetical protein
MKRTGRPPLSDDGDSVPVHVKLSPRDYDETYRRARRDRVSVPEQIRRELHAGRAVPVLPRNLK